MRFSSLQIRLLLTMAVVVTVAVGTVAFFASRSTTSEFRRSVEGILSIRNYSIETRIHAINKLLAQKEGDRDLWEDMQYLLEGMARTSRARFVLADLQGYVLADSLQELVGTQIDSERSKPFAAFLIEKRPVLAYLVPLEESGLESIEARFITSVNRSLLVAILAAGLVALLLSLLFSRSLLRPIGALTSAARAMEKGDLSQRVSVRTSGEIGELARAFNAMADGLARLEQLRRNMVTDVAHELRTPLSNVRGYLEALRDGVIKPTPETIASLHEEAMLLNRLVDDLQELALVEAGQLNLVRQPVQVGEVVERAVQLLEPKARKKGLAVEVCLAKDLPPIEADAERLGQVIRNLLDNALTNTPPGGEIRVSARTSEDRVEVSVQDTGQGIAPEHLPYVFERFYRADQSRTRSTGGAGLGLAIVKQLVEAHGGQVWIESQPGIGTTVTFTSPVATGVTNRASQPFHLQPATKIVER
jgi:signal transduction histidine kinase